MTAEELTTILYRKMKAEQNTYRDWLLGLPPEEILDHAYEYSVREDILMALAERDVTVEQGSALLDSPSPLADIYQEWQKLETRYMEDVRDTIESCANRLVFRDRVGAD